MNVRSYCAEYNLFSDTITSEYYLKVFWLTDMHLISWMQKSLCVHVAHRFVTVRAEPWALSAAFEETKANNLLTPMEFDSKNYLCSFVVSLFSFLFYIHSNKQIFHILYKEVLIVFDCILLTK